MESYECRICHKKYLRLLYKESCEKSHNIIYVPLFKEDVAKLMRFIYEAYVYADVESEIPSRLMKTLNKILTLPGAQETYDFSEDLPDLQERDTDRGIEDVDVIRPPIF